MQDGPNNKEDQTSLEKFSAWKINLHGSLHDYIVVNASWNILNDC